MNSILDDNKKMRMERNAISKRLAELDLLIPSWTLKLVADRALSVDVPEEVAMMAEFVKELSNKDSVLYRGKEPLSGEAFDNVLRSVLGFYPNKEVTEGVYAFFLNVDLLETHRVTVTLNNTSSIDMTPLTIN